MVADDLAGLAANSPRRRAAWDNRDVRWVVAAGIVGAAALWGGEVLGPQASGLRHLREGDAEARTVALPRLERQEEAAAVDEEAHEVAVEGDLSIYVVRGRAGRAAPIVFLTGSCTHPLTYVNAFRHAAAEHGGLIALQGDLPCKADPTLRRWSPDAVATSARIDLALEAAGASSSKEDLTVIGYSQGAERAEWLAHRFPAKYTRFVLMAGPVVPAPARFSGARAVATLAGYGDVRENMAAGAKRLRRASIPATYLELPGGTHHGELAADADVSVGRALDWIDANARALALRTESQPGADRRLE